MEIIYNSYQIIIKFLIIFSMVGCSYLKETNSQNDIYAISKKGDTLSFSLFSKAQNILKSDKWHFIWIDLYDTKNDKYDTRLIVCDSNLILRGSCPAPKAVIYKAKEDTLFGWTIDEWESEKTRNNFESDLPHEIKVQLKKKKINWNGYQSIAHAIVDSIQFIPESLSLKIFNRCSDSVSFPGRNEFFADDEYYSKQFNRREVLVLPISKVFFHRSYDYLYKIENDDLQVEMHTLDDKIINKLLLEVWHFFAGTSNPTVKRVSSSLPVICSVLPPLGL